VLALPAFARDLARAHGAAAQFSILKTAVEISTCATCSGNGWRYSADSACGRLGQALIDCAGSPQSDDALSDAAYAGPITTPVR
jgi:hypothetical protein